MTLYDKAKKAKDFILSKISCVPEVVIVLGSGLGSFAYEIEREVEIDYGDIPGFPVSTAPGHKGKLIFGTVSGKKIVAMQGRFHFYEGYKSDDIILPVRTFQLMGVQKYIVTNAAGAVNLDYKPGDIMIIEDHISLFCPPVLHGQNDERFGVRFPSMCEAYDRDMMKIAEKAACECDISVKKGVYCYCKGPMFETPAEIRMLRTLGADAVGMSTVPEVIAAAHGGMKTLGLSCMTNMAAGILDKPLTHEEVIETGKAVEKSFSKYMRKIVAAI